VSGWVQAGPPGTCQTNPIRPAARPFCFVSDCPAGELCNRTQV
jgi:hypothetical protein